MLMVKAAGWIIDTCVLECVRLLQVKDITTELSENLAIASDDTFDGIVYIYTVMHL